MIYQIYDGLFNADDSPFLQVGDGQEKEVLLSLIRVWMTKKK